MAAAASVSRSWTMAPKPRCGKSELLPLTTADFPEPDFWGNQPGQVFVKLAFPTSELVRREIVPIQRPQCPSPGHNPLSVLFQRLSCCFL